MFLFLLYDQMPADIRKLEVFRASRQYLLYAVFFVEVAFSLYLLIRHMLGRKRNAERNF